MKPRALLRPVTWVLDRLVDVLVIVLALVIIAVVFAFVREPGPERDPPNARKP